MSIEVYAAQPREGTETFLCGAGWLSVRILPGLCSSTPRGDGNLSSISRLCATSTTAGLCSSTPRGDGNKHGSLRRKLSFCKVYAAQPREGTETRISSLVSICRIARFMQLNPARGRKHDEYSEWLAHYGTRFMQLNPARGRKL